MQRRTIIESSNQIRYFATFGQKVSETTIGVPVETFQNERRVALSPEAAQRLIKLGFKIQVEAGAGAKADFNDDSYKAVGASIVSKDEAITSDLVLKVRAPS